MLGALGLLVATGSAWYFLGGPADIDADLTPASGWIIPFDAPQDLTRARYVMPRDEIDAIRRRIGEAMARDNELSNRRRSFYGSRAMAHFNSFIPFKISFTEEPEDQANHSRWTFERGRLVNVEVVREGAVGHVEKIWYDDLLRPILTVGYGRDGDAGRHRWGEYGEDGLLRRVTVFHSRFELNAVHLYQCEGDYDSCDEYDYDGGSGDLNFARRIEDGRVVQFSLRKNEYSDIGPVSRLRRINAWTEMGMEPIYPPPSAWRGIAVAAAPTLEDSSGVAPVAAGTLSLHEILSAENLPVRERLAAIDQRLTVGAFVDALDDDRRTPLHVSSRRRGQRAIVERLLEAGADVHAVDSSGRTPLHLAALANNIPAMMLLLENGADLEARDAARNTPLHFGARPRNNDAAAFLLERRADVHAANDRGRTPLHIAAALLRADVVEQLLEAGASTKVLDDEGATPLVTIGRGYTATKGDNRIDRAKRTIEAVLAGGAGINETDDAGMTLLHRVSSRGPLCDEAIVRFLIDEGADPALRDADGNTAKDIAAQSGNAAIVSLL